MPVKTPRGPRKWHQYDPVAIHFAYGPHLAGSIAGAMLSHGGAMRITDGEGPTDAEGRQREVEQESAVAWAAKVFEQMAPRDPLEQMLVSQVMWTHARAAHLNKMAVLQQQTKHVQVCNDAADRATNTFRRLMLALGQYRNPRQFTAIRKQVNNAEQQVVANGQIPNGKPETIGKSTNEQGALPAAGGRPALPAVGPGVGVAAGDGRPREAVGAVDRPVDSGREGPEQPQRLQARRAVGGGGGDPQADPGAAGGDAGGGGG